VSAALCLALALAAGAPREVDLVVRGGTLVTMDAGKRVLADGALAIDKGRIVALAPAPQIAGAYRGRETLEAGGGIVMPGLINTHSHAAMVLFRGIADDLRLMEWLQRYIFPAEARNVTADFVRAGTRLAAAEMIKSGTTTFVDMYYFEDQVAEVAKQAGIRVVAGTTFIDFPAPDNKTRDEAVACAERFLKKWAGDPLVTAAVAPHSTYLCSPDTLKIAKAVADKYGAPILIHLSESEDEQKQVLERYGKTSTEHLRDLGFLRKGVVGAHGVWLSGSDREILRKADVGIAHCPESNMKIAVGAAPVREMLAEGMRLGLGTDGAASNNDLDMFEEMLAAALLAKHASHDPTSAPAPAVLEMATLGGARALGMEDQLGSLEPGKRADLIVVGLEAPRLHPLYDPVSHLVYAAKGADVRHSVIEGRVVMRDRKLVTLDEAAVVAEADRYRRQVSESLSRAESPAAAAPGPEFLGTLVDQQGAPVTGATVLLLPEGTLVLDVRDDRARATNPTARTDATGRFALGFDGRPYHGSHSFHLYWVAPGDRFLPVVGTSGRPLVVEAGPAARESELGRVVAGDH
jgi:5-methylthioadenosine/S-adenosylhomocysteine deaminase